MVISAAAEFLFCRFRRFREIRGFVSDQPMQLSTAGSVYGLRLHDGFWLTHLYCGGGGWWKLLPERGFLKDVGLRSAVSQSFLL
jgi:hypothetical protein